MPNYQNGYIYKIWSLQTEEIYIGSSTTDPRKRLCDHKMKYKLFLKGKIKYRTTSFDIVQYPDCKIEIIEKYPCNSRAELCKREGEIQRETKCCNRNIAGRTIKEYYKDNEEKIKEYYRGYNKKYSHMYYIRRKTKKFKIILDELYSVLTCKDDIPLIEAINEIQSLLYQEKKKEKEKSDKKFLKIKIIKKN